MKEVTLILDWGNRSVVAAFADSLEGTREFSRLRRSPESRGSQLSLTTVDIVPGGGIPGEPCICSLRSNLVCPKHGMRTAVSGDPTPGPSPANKKES